MSGSWPTQDRAAMNAFYGCPDRNGDGMADTLWEGTNIVRLVPAYKMVLAWDTARPVTAIRVHRKCAESLDRVLRKIAAHYGNQAAIEKARLHLYGGCMNFRMMRGGTQLSIHSWGAAIDLDPAGNPLGQAWRPGMMPHAVVDIFATEGWVWGGAWRRPDAQHFQAATIGD